MVAVHGERGVRESDVAMDLCSDYLCTPSLRRAIYASCDDPRLADRKNLLVCSVSPGFLEQNDLPTD